jgi:flagellar motility protein MotE (MotC chaperone)
VSPSRFRVLLVVSAVAFVGGTVISVLSGSEYASATDQTEQPAPKQSDAAVDPNSGCLADPAVLDDIRSQREKLADMKKALDERDAELTKREQAVAEEIKKIETAREAIEKIEESKKDISEEKVAKLVETFETMSPKASAKVLAELDERLAVATITRMDTAKLSKIMNLMEPQRSVRLTELLAGVGKAKTATIPNFGGGSPASKPTTSNQSEKGGVSNNGQHNNDNNSSQSSRHDDVAGGNQKQAGDRQASAGPQG